MFHLQTLSTCRRNSSSYLFSEDIDDSKTFVTGVTSFIRTRKPEGKKGFFGSRPIFGTHQPTGAVFGHQSKCLGSSPAPGVDTSAFLFESSPMGPLLLPPLIVYSFNKETFEVKILGLSTSLTQMQGCDWWIRISGNDAPIITLHSSGLS